MHIGMIGVSLSESHINGEAVYEFLWYVGHRRGVSYIDNALCSIQILHTMQRPYDGNVCVLHYASSQRWTKPGCKFMPRIAQSIALFPNSSDNCSCAILGHSYY